MGEETPRYPSTSLDYFSYLTILVACSKFWQFSTLLLNLVNSSHHGAVGSASAWKTRGRGYEPVPMRYIFIGKYPVA